MYWNVWYSRSYKEEGSQRVTEIVGPGECGSCLHEGGGEGLVNGFGDGQRWDHGAVVERNLKFAEEC